MSNETRSLAKDKERLEGIKSFIRRILFGDLKRYEGTEEIENFRQYVRSLCLEDLFIFDYLVLSSSPEGTCKDIEYRIHYPGTLIISKTAVDEELLDVLSEIKDSSDGAFDYSSNIEVGMPLGLVACEYPTGFYKTSALKRGGALWSYLRCPEERQLISRETATLAYQDMDFLMQQVENNSVFRWLFGETLPETRPKKWSKNAFNMPRQGTYGEPCFMALGVGGAIRGLHFTTIWLDDIHGERAMKSSIVMDQTITWGLNIATRLIGELNKLDETSGIFPRIRITQNRASNWDCHSAFEESYKEKFVWIRYKALNSKLESVYPHKYTTEELRRKMNSENPTERLILWIQFMNDPKESELNEFKTEWLRFFDLQFMAGKWVIIDRTSDEKIEEIDLAHCFLLGWVDLATGKETKHGSQNAVVIVALAPNGKKYIIEAWRKKTHQGDLITKIIHFHDSYNLNVLLIENYAEQSEFKYWLDRELRAARRILRTELMTPASGKWIRIPDLTLYFKKGELLAREEQRELRTEYESWPYISVCDVLDALSATIPLWKSYRPSLKKVRAIFQPVLNKVTGV